MAVKGSPKATRSATAAAPKAASKTALKSAKPQAKSALKATSPKKAVAKKAAGKSVSKAKSAERVREILQLLDEAYPVAECALEHNSPWELLVATILSAQCTDVRVNMVTPALFKRFPTPEAFASAGLEEIEEKIRSTGFFHNKAKSIKGAAVKLLSDFGGRVPETLAELTTLPGAARKTASVVLGVCFGKAEGVVVDTHVLRISRRLDLATSETAEKVERELMQILPHERWISFSHQIIHHGRQVCMARKPECKRCNLEQLCKAEDKRWSS